MSGHWRRLAGGGARSVGLPRGLQSVRLAADGAHAAAVRASARGAVLLYGLPGQRLSILARGSTFTPPTFDASGDVVSVRTTAAGRDVVAVSPSGGLHPVSAAATLTGQQVQQLEFSPDGARVAAVIGPVGAGRLLVGRVSYARGRATLDAFRSVLASFGDVRGLSWNGSDELMVTAAAGAGRDVVTVDVDGYAVRTIATSGIRGEPVEVAAASGRPLVVATADGLWSDRVDGTWRQVGVGSDPSYAA
jgi:hypothetical protein